LEFRNGDLIIVDGACYRISDSRLIPVNDPCTVKNVPLKELKEHPGKEFVVYGNTGISDTDKCSVVTYLGTRVNKKRYYHELNKNTVVQILDFNTGEKKSE